MPASQIGEFRDMSIGEACEVFGLTPRAIRFYEERGLVKARRDRRNRRHYDAEGRRRLGWIAQLRSAGLPLAGIKEVFKLEDAKRSPADIALTHLERRRVQIVADLRMVEATMAALLSFVELDRSSKHQRVDAA